jgi:hypothetical protein
MEQIGFIIVAYNHPQQLLRLVRRLQQMYDNPPIAIHYDVGQSPIRPADFPPDVKFVSPHLKTRWGHISVVEASLRTLKLLYDRAEPKWFFSLSGSDYPTMPANIVLNELKSVEVDALLDYREVPNIGADSYCPPPDNPALRNFTLPTNLALAWRRYVELVVWFPIIRRGPRFGRYKLYLAREAWNSPFGPGFKCFFGDYWFAGNSKVARILLNPTRMHLRLRRYLRFRPVPEECYYQTILANTVGLKISTATRRFANWVDDGPHPRVLDLGDLAAITQSRAYFARKFAPNSPVLDELDKNLC